MFSLDINLDLINLSLDINLDLINLSLDKNLDLINLSLDINLARGENERNNACNAGVEYSGCN